MNLIHYVRQGARLLYYFLIVLTCTVVVYMLCAVSLSLIAIKSSSYDCTPKTRVYVSSNGVHVDLILNTFDLDPELYQRLRVDPSFRYIAFGWGDEKFYLETPRWRDLKMTTALNAVLLPSEAAMHVTPLRQKGNGWHHHEVCNAQLKSLNEHILNSFAQDSMGDFVLIEASGYSDIDRFYEAVGHYHLINTSNEWTNRGLKRAGIKTSIWSPFEFGILYHAHKSL